MCHIRRTTCAILGRACAILGWRRPRAAAAERGGANPTLIWLEWPREARRAARCSTLPFSGACRCARAVRVEGGACTRRRVDGAGLEREGGSLACSVYCPLSLTLADLNSCFCTNSGNSARQPIAESSHLRQHPTEATDERGGFVTDQRGGFTTDERGGFTTDQRRRGLKSAPLPRVAQRPLEHIGRLDARKQPHVLGRRHKRRRAPPLGWRHVGPAQPLALLHAAQAVGELLRRFRELRVAELRVVALIGGEPKLALLGDPHPVAQASEQRPFDTNGDEMLISTRGFDSRQRTA
eukprot:7384236-Prymnesium_polylepis.2